MPLNPGCTHFDSGVFENPEPCHETKSSASPAAWKYSAELRIAPRTCSSVMPCCSAVTQPFTSAGAAQAEVVACHPKEAVVAVGHADGLVLLVRLDDGAEILARERGDAPVTALTWNAAGSMLAFGTEDGAAGVIAL